MKMLFRDLVSYFERLEKTTKRLEMTDIVAELFSNAGEELYNVALFVQGHAFPAWSEKELGIAQKTMVKCLVTVTGASEDNIKKRIAETGDTGLAAEGFCQEKAQQTLFTQELTVERIAGVFDKVSTLSGTGSTDKKLKYVAELLSSAQSGAEAKYLVRLVLNEMRFGVGEGIVRDGISQAFQVDAAETERAYSVINDYGEVAVIARNSGDAGLKKVSMRLWRPLKPMLAQSVKSVEEAFENFKGPAGFEYKYDGMRAQIHIEGDKIRIFTRRLDEVTKQFPDVVEMVGKDLKPEKNAVVEGEVVAYREGKPLPFQYLSRRVKRKYGIRGMVKEIPVQLFLYDCIYMDGEDMIQTPFRERRKTLESISGGKHLSGILVTDNTEKAGKFYGDAIEGGHEGLMVKNLDAGYKPGSRVGYMYKLKPTAETLDLVLIGAEWGEGRRAKWLGSYLLGARDEDTGKLLPIGRMATGITDQQLEELTQELKEDAISESGKEVKLKPRLVVEVGYQEIQRSPNYESGFALRFPRLIQVRTDKSPDEADSVQRVKSIIG
jgi:DNA ligase-1